MVYVEFTLTYFEVYLIAISLVSFLLYGYDKALALKTHKNISRISENKLLLSTLLGGTIGSVIAMMLFRHKIKKKSFTLKFLLVVIVHVVAVVVFVKELYKFNTLI
ncbi:DUF1294 domain-containing protein [Sulfurimonas sp. SAG-AH-194-I05]|nr:DUF1294 domain-containing protein [Sulfurimonas sp. SAG-AH-194-I05]MDF1875667.1 DUF1294 domain-containing protein [Sulfurimonas sp. SAG-AH-194-I05]